MESRSISKQKFFGNTTIDVVGTPFISESFGRFDYVLFGDNNLWPQELLRIYQNSSPLHTGLCKKKADMIAGLGFNPIAGLEPFLRNEFSKEDLNMIVYKTAMDLVLFGGYYLQIIWAKGGKQIAQIEHVPYEKVRAQKPCATDYFGEPNHNDEVLNYYISKDWSRTRRSDNAPYLIPAFNERLSNECPSQLLGVMSYTPGMEYYSLPDYMSIINWLRLDYNISVFHLKSVTNGFTPSMIITMKDGAPATDEEREKEYRQLKERYASALNAGDFLLVYADSDLTAPTFTPIQLNDSDTRFADLMIQINQEILVGHGATSPVGGIETSGKLGSADEISDAYKLFQLTKISQFQAIIERTFNKLAKINGYVGELTLTPYITLTKGGEVDTQTNMSNENTDVPAPVKDSNLTGLSAAENSDMYRIVRDFLKGKINEYLAITRLTAYGITEDSAKKILGLEE